MPTDEDPGGGRRPVDDAPTRRGRAPIASPGEPDTDRIGSEKGGARASRPTSGHALINSTEENNTTEPDDQATDWGPA